MLDHQPWANEVDAQDAGEILDSIVKDAFHAARNACVGKGNVEMAVQRNRFGNQCCNICLVACIHLYGSGGIADHGGCFMHRGCHVAQNDLGTFGSKADGGCAANA